MVRGSFQELGSSASMTLWYSRAIFRGRRMAAIVRGERAMIMTMLLVPPPYVNLLMGNMEKEARYISRVRYEE